MLLTLAVGLPSAYLFTHYQFPFKSLRAGFLTTLPFILPTVGLLPLSIHCMGRAVGLIWAMAAAQTSTPMINIVNSLGAILLAHVFLQYRSRHPGDWQRLGKTQSRLQRLPDAGCFSDPGIPADYIPAIIAVHPGFCHPGVFCLISPVLGSY